VGEKQYDEYYGGSHSGTQVHTSSSGETDTSDNPYAGGCGQTGNNALASAQDCPSAKETDAGNYSSSNPSWVGAGKAKGGSYSEEGGTEANKAVSSNPSRFASPFPLETDDSSQGCCHQEAKDHF